MAADRRAKNSLPDLIIPVLALAFTGYYLSTITDVPWISQASALTVGCLLVSAIIAFLIRTALRVKRGRETLALSGLPPDAMALTRMGLLALTIGYVAALEPLGFTLGTAVFVFLAVVLLSSPANWRAAALAALGCALGGYLVFIVLFKTRFPHGWIETTVQRLL